MVSVTILDCLMMFVAIGLVGSKLSTYSTPLASALGNGIGKWGYSFIIVGMLIPIFGVAFSASFNAPSLIASLADEQELLPAWVGKNNKHDAPWVGIIVTAILTGVFVTQSYLFLVSCTVLASFIQYVPSILAVIKFKHSNEFPNHGFKLPGKYTIPIIALIVSCYMVTNFTPVTLLVGVVVAAIGAVLYIFMDQDPAMEEMEKLHKEFLDKLRHNKIKF
jgi:amino acid transporter